MALLFIRNLVGKSATRVQYFNLTRGGHSCLQSLQNCFHSVVGPIPTQGTLGSGSTGGSIVSTPWSLISVRTTIRDNWPRPNERKRQRLNFWNRMKTPGGRAVIMRRYLKGRHVLSH